MPITKVIADRVRVLRSAAGLKGPAFAARVSEAGAAAGISWDRATVAKLETGRRASLTVQELLAIAMALNLPPAWLLSDPTPDGAPTPMPDGTSLDPWAALLWMTGQAPLRDVTDSWRTASNALHDAAQIVSAVQELKLAHVERLKPESARRTDDTITAEERRALQLIAFMRSRIADRKLAPPPIPDSVRHRARALDVPLDDVTDAGA